jgi:hypothetical protein
MDTYRYQGQVVTLVGEHDPHSTECTIRLLDGSEKTVNTNEITVEPGPAEATEVSGHAEKPAQS